MTPPLPPPGYELVEDEPVEGDRALCRGDWLFIDAALNVDLNMYSYDSMLVNARDLRWIARKI